MKTPWQPAKQANYHLSELSVPGVEMLLICSFKQPFVVINKLLLVNPTISISVDLLQQPIVHGLCPCSIAFLVV